LKKLLPLFFGGNLPFLVSVHGFFVGQNDEAAHVDYSWLMIYVRLRNAIVNRGKATGRKLFIYRKDWTLLLVDSAMP
jgi:hypothetical protein